MVELAMIGHFLATWLGLTNASGPIYSFWSGWFGDLSILAVPVVLLRSKNCHAHRCWRLGRHPVEGTPFTVCKAHLPPKTSDHSIEAIHAAHETYLESKKQDGGS